MFMNIVYLISMTLFSSISAHYDLRVWALFIITYFFSTNRLRMSVHNPDSDRVLCRVTFACCLLATYLHDHFWLMLVMYCLALTFIVKEKENA